MSRDDWIVIASYLLGGCVLSVFGPDLWGLPTIFAAAAAFGAALTFCFAHIVWRAFSNVLLRRRARAVRRAAMNAPAEDLIQAPANDDPVATGTERTADPETLNLDLSLQPIVSLKDGRPRHYMARANICVAADEDALAKTVSDTLKIAEVIALVNQLGKTNADAHIFCGIAADTLGDPAFRRDLIDLVAKVPALSKRLVFEVDAEMAVLTHRAAADLAELTRIGFAVCVRLSAAEQVKLNFIGTLRKLPATEMVTLTEGAILAQRRCGMTLIATDIGDEDMVDDLARRGVSLGDGEIFGSARTISRPSLVQLAA